MTAKTALQRMLTGSGYRASQVGSTAFRIEPVRVNISERPVVRFSPPRTPRTSTLSATLSGDIIVTGQKQPQALQAVPMSLAVVDLGSVQSGRLSAGTRDIVDATDGIAITNLGPGRNRQFIRGVADSPFNGPSQSTVAVQLDEARVTYDAPDPDIRVVDMDRIEVLKGPQGPLYGSGALGGIYHIVTRKPDLAEPSAAVRIGTEGVAHGGVGGGVDAVLNLPLVSDRLAVRGVGYVVREAGWIDNEGRDSNANVTKVAGARLAARWQAAPNWMLDLSGILQDVNTRDSQYVTASDDTIKRSATIAEPTDNDFRSAAVTIHGKLGELDLLGTSSYVRHQVDTILDSTPASSAFGLTGATKFSDDRNFQILNHEVRVSSSSGFRWLAGLSYLDARSRSSGVISDGTTHLTVEALNRAVSEIAGFGEVTLPILRSVKATAGARLFRSQAEDETIEEAGGGVDRTDKTVLSPSLAISWAPDATTLIYLRYARAVRPGGLALSADMQGGSRRFDSDELGTFDLGIRLSRPEARVSLSASAFQTDWQHVQSDYLLANGLISTRNAGRGRIYGAEANADWRPRDEVLLSFGAAYVDAHLVRDDANEELDDRRLPVTPDLTLRALAQYRFDLGSWTTTTGAQANYIGASRLSFDPDLDRKMGRYATVGLSALASHGRLILTARVDNLLDAKGDSFAFGNPFSIRSGPQYTPNRPRTFSFSIGRNW